jgi:hypothetical protein
MSPPRPVRICDRPDTVVYVPVKGELVSTECAKRRIAEGRATHRCPTSRQFRGDIGKALC